MLSDLAEESSKTRPRLPSRRHCLKPPAGYRLTLTPPRRWRVTYDIKKANRAMWDLFDETSMT